MPSKFQLYVVLKKIDYFLFAINLIYMIYLIYRIYLTCVIKFNFSPLPNNK